MLIVFKHSPTAINFDNVTEFFIDDESLCFNTTNANDIISIDYHDRIRANMVFKLIISAFVDGEKVFYLPTR